MLAPRWRVVVALFIGLRVESRGKAVSDVFGLAALATIMSVVGLGWRSGAGLGPALAGFVHDLTGSYTPSFAFGVLAGRGLDAVPARQRTLDWGAPKWPPKPPNVRRAPAKPGRSSIHFSNIYFSKTICVWI